MKKSLKILLVSMCSILVTFSLFCIIPLLGGLQKSYAADPFLIDINPGTGDSNIDKLVDVNGILYFRATNETSGVELWKSDGTVDGTSMVKDIYAGSNGGYPDNLTNVNGVLYFSATDGTNGVELWKSDGTEANTVMVKDITSGSADSSPSELIDVDGTLFFWIDNALWKSDGTADGTLLIKNITSGTGYSRFAGAALGSNYIFLRKDELWISDGTEAGTIRITSFYAAGAVTLDYVNGVLLFVGTATSSSDQEIWKTDGTVAGTAILKSGIGLSGYNGPFLLDGSLYFWIYGSVGYELWKTDGTEAGTVKIEDSAYSVSSSEYPVVMGQNAYFIAADGDWAYGEELWTTDGTAGGAHMVKDIYSGSDASSISEITAVNGMLYFNATDETENGYNTEPWKSDGTEEGTVMLANLNTALEEGSYPENFTKVGDMLFFEAWTNEYGTELYSLSTAVELSTDSSLSALTVSDCSLSPTFDAAETSYTCTVSQSIGSVNVTGTTAFVGATLTVDGLTATSGSSKRVNLMSGANEIPVTVTAEDGTTTTTYTISITKPTIDGASYYTYDSTLDFGNSSTLEKPYISTIDKDNNIIVGGYYTGTTSIDFDPGEGTAMSPASPNHFILKLNSNREFVWVKFFRIISGSFNGLETDSNGNIFLAGTYTDYLDLNPSVSAEQIVESGHDGAGFLIKLNSSGTYVWGRADDFPTGEVGLWNLDEVADNSCSDGGDVCDNSGIANDGILYGTAPTVSTSNGKGRDFDGVNGTYVDIGDLSLFENQTFTIEAYVKKEGTCGAYDYCSIMSKGSSTNKGFGFGISNGKLQIRINDMGTSGVEYLDGATDLAIDTWYYVAAVVNGEEKTFELYVNNSLDASGSFTERINYAGSNHVKIGNANDGNDLPFNGVIDGVRYSNVVRDSTYIQSMNSKYTTGSGSDVGSYIAPITSQIGGQISANIVVDENGSVVVGYSSGDAYSSPIFRKFDSSGNILWTKEFDNTGNSYFTFESIALDSQENILLNGYVLGGFADFNPGTGVDQKTPTGGNKAIFVTKLTTNGSYVWTQLINSASTTFGINSILKTDGDDNILVFSDFYGTVDLDPGLPTVDVTSIGNNDLLLLKLNPNGEYIWGKNFAGASYDEAIDLAVNSDNNIFLSGSSNSSTITVDSSTFSLEKKTSYREPIFLELNSSGDYVFSKVILVNSSSHAETYKILFDSNDDMYYTGYYTGSLDFNDGEIALEKSVFTSPSDRNMFLAKYNKVLSTNSSLSLLSTSGFTLSPAFDSSVTSYTGSVDFVVDSVDFIPISAFPGASVSINGEDVMSGNQYEISLATGVNNISIVVTAEDGVATSTYSIVITRNTASTVSSLSALSISGCMLSPSFSSEVKAYSCFVPSTLASINVIPTASSSMAKISVRGSSVISGNAHNIYIATGVTNIPIIVTAEDGLTTSTYNITLTKSAEDVSSDSSLSSLEIPGVILSPAFDPSITSYTGNVDFYIDSINIIPTASSLGSIITVNGVSVDQGDSYSVDLEVGINDILIMITGEDSETTSTYNLKIIKASSTIEEPTRTTPDSTARQDTPLKDVLSVLTISISEASKYVEKTIQEIPISEQTSRNITAATLALIAVSPAVSVGLGSSYTISYIAKFFSMILALFGIGRKKRNCGLVYDSVTKEPVSNAIVRIYSTDGTLVATEVTDVYGIFETDIESGQYSIVTQVNNYKFPSMLITGTQDLPYENIYGGGNFNYDSSSSISYSIPVDPLDKSNAEYANTITKHKLINLTSSALNILMFIGLVFSIVSYIKLNSTLNLILLIIYVFLIILGMIRRRQARYRFGTVTDRSGDSKNGIELGLMETEFNRIYAKRVTNDEGKYRFIVPGGDYKLVSLDPECSLYGEVLVSGRSKKIMVVSEDLVAERRV